MHPIRSRIGGNACIVGLRAGSRKKLKQTKAKEGKNWKPSHTEMHPIRGRNGGHVGVIGVRAAVHVLCPVCLSRVPPVCVVLSVPVVFSVFGAVRLDFNVLLLHRGLVVSV